MPKGGSSQGSSINAKAAKYHFGKQVNVNTTISMVSVCGKDLSKPNYCKRNMKYINYSQNESKVAFTSGTYLVYKLNFHYLYNDLYLLLMYMNGASTSKRFFDHIPMFI